LTHGFILGVCSFPLLQWNNAKWYDMLRFATNHIAYHLFLSVPKGAGSPAELRLQAPFHGTIAMSLMKTVACKLTHQLIPSVSALTAECLVRCFPTGSLIRCWLEDLFFVDASCADISKWRSRRQELQVRPEHPQRSRLLWPLCGLGYCCWMKRLKWALVGMSRGRRWVWGELCLEGKRFGSRSVSRSKERMSRSIQG
jgi:hypothetical protein